MTEKDDSVAGEDGVEEDDESGRAGTGGVELRENGAGSERSRTREGLYELDERILQGDRTMWRRSVSKHDWRRDASEIQCTSPISLGNVATGILTGMLMPLYTTFVSKKCVSFGRAPAPPARCDIVGDA
jgi:hypothetical protein